MAAQDIVMRHYKDDSGLGDRILLLRFCYVLEKPKE